MGQPLVLGWAWRRPLPWTWYRVDPDPCSWPLAHPPRNFLLLVELEQVVVTAYRPRPRGSSCSDVQLGAPGCRGAEVVRDALSSHRGEDSVVRSQPSPSAVMLDVHCPL